MLCALNTPIQVLVVQFSVLFSNARDHVVFRCYNVTAEFASKIKTWLISSDGWCYLFHACCNPMVLHELVERLPMSQGPNPKDSN